jgi:hypothetical protein
MADIRRTEEEALRLRVARRKSLKWFFVNTVIAGELTDPARELQIQVLDAHGRAKAVGYGFVYFREWLISRGRAVYTTTVENPDSLAGFTDPERDDYEFEHLGYLPLEVYETLTGEGMPVIYPSGKVEPKGKRWDFHDDAEILRRLPNLAKVYPA